MESGNLGDHKALGRGLAEMRVDYGPGYRIYYGRRGASIILLLCGGDKHTQTRDIAKARKLLEELNL
jgi:putative addiction module killer protein